MTEIANKYLDDVVNEAPAKNVYSGRDLISYLSKDDGLNVHFSKDSQSVDKLTEDLEGQLFN